MSTTRGSRLVPYRDLKDPALRRRTEAAQGFFVAEGKLAVLAVLGSPYPLLSVLVLRRRLAVLSELALPPGVAVYVVEDKVMSAVAGFDVHRGVLGLAARRPCRPAACWRRPGRRPWWSSRA